MRRPQGIADKGQPAGYRRNKKPPGFFAEATTGPVDIAAFHGFDQDDLTEKARIAMLQLI
ncbi:MAG: hypothetical protein QGH07_16190 [Alphaproteobacteria bacterium]|nr:hypothetical protein [Alphaproteobacteria bacterium]